MREVALASATASVRIFFIRASGAKGLPLMMPMAAIGPINSASSDRCRLLLHDLVEHLVIAEVVGRDGVHHLAGAFVEHGRRRRGDGPSLALPARNSAMGVP